MGAMLELDGYSFEVVVYEGVETTVHRGKRITDGRPVVAKATRGDFATFRATSRLRREHAILAELDVPRVPRAIELCTHGRGLALVMDDVGTTNLHEFITAKGRLSVKETLRIAISISATLALLHRRHIVHKDIKPRNVIVDAATLEPYLVDFGIAARISREMQASTSPDALEGTPAYLSPEQTGRTNRAVDCRADLYSLGVTLYEMLSGALPFSGMDAAEVVHAHLTQTPSPLFSLGIGVPEGFSAVVAKLLAKAPEGRYQSAAGLLADLETCEEALAKTGTIAEFPLGSADIVEQIVWPDRVIGREAEATAITKALDRARLGEPILVILQGPAGVGKSALVASLDWSTASAFAVGSYEEARVVPLLGISKVMASLVRACLAESREMLAKKRSELEDAVGASGRILIEICPEVELLIGPQPELPHIKPNETKIRLARAVRRFFSCFAREKAPLAIFLDDFQWADAMSVEIVSSLISDPETRDILVVCACRDDAGQSLFQAAQGLSRTPPIMLNMAPFGAEMATLLVAEALRAPIEGVKELGALVWEKTAGNPFFMMQFLMTLEKDGIVRFDPALSTFTWDFERIASVAVTDNVLAFMARKIEGFAPELRRVFCAAACLGMRFELSTLSALLGKKAGEVAAALLIVVEEGLISPIGGDYRLLDAVVELPADVSLSIAYQFLHDRVREGAVALLSAEEIAENHAAIGRILLPQVMRDGVLLKGIAEEIYLDVAEHANLGERAYRDPEERHWIARLNQHAGEVAKERGAYEAAADLFAKGRLFLGEDGFVKDRKLAYELTLQGASCEWVRGAIDTSDALVDRLLAQSRDNVESAAAYCVRLEARISQGKNTEAVAVGLSALALLGVTFPESEGERQAEFGRLLGVLGEICSVDRMDTLVQGALLEDPREITIQKVLAELTLPTYLSVLSLYGPVNLELVRRSIAIGQTPHSPFAYLAYGFLLGAFLGRGVEGVAIAKVALSLAHRWGDKGLAAKILSGLSAFGHTALPVQSLEELIDKAIPWALDAGDLVYAHNLAYQTPFHLLASGTRLEEALARTGPRVQTAESARNVLGIVTVKVARQVFLCLLGRTRGRTDFEDDTFHAASLKALLDEKEHGIVFFYWASVCAFVSFVYGEASTTLAHIAEARRYAAAAIGLYWNHELSFMEGISHAILGFASEGEARKDSLVALEATIAKLEALVSAYPKNHQHKLELLIAERDGLAGDVLSALNHYDQAIALARENEFPHHEAIANERAGRYLLSIGRERAAAGYLAYAYRGFLAWGAEPKANLLSAEISALYGPLLLDVRRGVSSLSADPSATANFGAGLSGMTIGLTNYSRGSLRDAALVLRAAQAIAGELVLSRVVSKLMRIVLENSGADRAALLLSHDDHLFVEAKVVASQEAIEVGIGRPIEDEPDLPQKIVLTSWRTREAIVLEDATLSSQFSSDVYIARTQVRSVYCVPVSYQGRPTGMLYLENKGAVGVFTAVRTELVGLLATQAAIAIENALLVERIQEANEKVHAVNARLEEDVRHRTALLEQSNDELVKASQQLLAELEQRSKDEMEREMLREQVVAAQTARLAELSAPLLPIAEGVLLLPIIGTMDAERAAKVMEVALAGAVNHGARALILDISGMHQVDTLGVNALVSVANALKLVGTEVIVTGVRSQVARAMVEEGIGLVGLRTLSTLKEGITRALSSASARRASSARR